MKVAEAMQAINAREGGVFDHPALLALGPLGNGPDDVTAIKRRCLESYGFTIGPRHPEIHTDFSGDWMVCEAFEEATLPSRDGSDGPWCVVGNDLPALISNGFDFLVSCDL